MARPRKNQHAPPPYYLTDENVRYCHSCGRHIGTHKRAKGASNPAEAQIKFCSDRCRSWKKASAQLDARIEEALLSLLRGDRRTQPQGTSKIASGGDQRRTAVGLQVRISEIENLVFAMQRDDEQGSEEPGDDSRLSNRTADTEAVSSDSDSEATFRKSTEKPRNLPRQQSTAHEMASSERRKQQEGQRRADERELIKSAARRAVVFGLSVDCSDRDGSRTTRESPREGVRRKCEALVNGRVVEPSFAKGDWQIRWRED